MRRVIAILLILSLSLALFSGCKSEDENKLPADYGTYGVEFARRLATEYPYRKAYTVQETLAGSMIKSEFEALGYEVQTQEFRGSEGFASNNYIAVHNGAGFYSKNEDTGEYVPTERYIIVGAHYDSKYTREELDAFNAKHGTEYEYDGINDNASGVAALMTCAKEINEYNTMGFTVIFVAFGASSDDFAGARAFYSGLTADVRSKTEAMFCIDSIYAGDKIYANSGLNSLVLTRKYQMRRKLYQSYDVAYDNSLYSTYGFNLLYNESRIQTDLNGDDNADIYSEVSLNKSDYIPFDNGKIPIVFFDSYDYNFKTIEEMHDTKNLDLQAFEGMIRGTYLDSMATLDPILITEESDVLQTRINCIAFIIIGVGMKGSDTALTYTEYMEALESERYTEETSASVEGSV